MDFSKTMFLFSVNCRRVPWPEILLGRHANVKAVQFTVRRDRSLILQVIGTKTKGNG